MAVSPKTAELSNLHTTLCALGLADFAKLPSRTRTRARARTHACAHARTPSHTHANTLTLASARPRQARERPLQHAYAASRKREIRARANSLHTWPNLTGSVQRLRSDDTEIIHI
eukprot:6200067-Pleurochrysis_carterae.AAC.1